MNQETSGATNGAPEGNEELSCVIVAGDFLKILLEQRINEESIEEHAISSGVINSLTENDVPITLKLEDNTVKDIAFIEMCEKNPLIAKMKLTPEEWNARLSEYLRKIQDTDKDIE